MAVSSGDSILRNDPVAIGVPLDRIRRANRSSQKRSKVNVRHVVEGLEWRSPLSLL